MMIENKQARQFKGDARRRWFSDDYFDLIVWEKNNKEIARFELCYNKVRDEHAFIWNQQDGLTHVKVDDGEGVTDRLKMSPIFVPDGHFDRAALASRFIESGKGIDQNIVQFVYNKLIDYDENHEK